MKDWLKRRILSLFPRHVSFYKAPDLVTSSNGSSSPEDSIPGASDSGRQPGSPSTEISHLTTQIDLSKSALLQACSNAEADFLNIGERLQTIYSQAGQMTRIAHTAVENIGLDTENSALATITNTAYQALGDFDQEQSRMTERMRNIGSICEHLRHLHGLTGVLNRIAKALLEKETLTRSEIDELMVGN